MILIPLKKLVSWIVYSGLKQEATLDNQWVVTLVSTLIVVFLLYQLLKGIGWIIKYFFRLWGKQVFSSG